MILANILDIINFAFSNLLFRDLSDCIPYAQII